MERARFKVEVSGQGTDGSHPPAGSQGHGREPEGWTGPDGRLFCRAMVPGMRREPVTGVDQLGSYPEGTQEWIKTQ